MNLRRWMRDVKRNFLYFTVGAVAAGGIFYTYSEKKAQQYTASALIEYKTTDGNAPDGTAIDTDEITSSEVISRACESIGVEQNADQIRQGIKITAVPDEKEEALYEAKLEHGEEYDMVTKRYLLSFTSDVSKGGEYPGKVLNAVLTEYFRYYGTYHSSVNLAVNSIDDISFRGYDYLETMDTINTAMDDAMELLTKRMDQDSAYRSASTGYSFQDLYEAFSYIRDMESPKISAKILEDRITRDADALVTTYQKKNEDLDIEDGVYGEKIDKIKKIIDTYVDMMKDSGNARIDMDEKTLQEVFDTHGIDSWNSKADKTTEYDRLLNNYVSAETGYQYNLIDKAYNEYVIDRFTDAPAADAAECAETESRIESLMDKVNDLFTKFNATNEEYNEYLGAQNVSMLAGVSVTKKINVKEYTAMVMMAAFLIEILLTAVYIRVTELAQLQEKEDREKE